MAYSLLFKVNNEFWNKGMIIGPKPLLKLKEDWAIRIRHQLSGDVRNLALFNLVIDSKLRACDLYRQLAYLHRLKRQKSYSST